MVVVPCIATHTIPSVRKKLARLIQPRKWAGGGDYLPGDMGVGISVQLGLGIVRHIES